MNIYYRLSATTDPEERLEDAALWKAMHDFYGDEIQLLKDTDSRPTNGVMFGRNRRNEPLGQYCDYWNDQGFLDNCAREFYLCDYGESELAVKSFHKRGKGAFVKSTRPKFFIKRIPVGASFADEVGAMAYSFIDFGKCLMVQELCTIEYEQRFLFIENNLITHSPVAWHLTPLDIGTIPAGAYFRTPQSKEYEIDNSRGLIDFAKSVHKQCKYPTVGIDCAWINGKPGVVEFNDFHIGQMGLYMCDVRKIAEASRINPPKTVKSL